MALVAELTEVLLRSGVGQAAAQLAALAAAKALRREAVALDSQRLRFIWLLLPEFWERPCTVAAASAASRGMAMLLKEEEKLHVSHLSLHPNSLTLEGLSKRDHALRGCLMKIALDRLLSVQFHMPRLTDVFELLEALATNPCRSLRKTVDRQSRWRPRELQFEQMEEEQRRLAANVTNLLNELPHLQHLEGPVFSVLLRARRHAASDCQPPARVSEALGARLRVLHLVDLCAADLFGLLPEGLEGGEPFCPCLQKLLLLNLPSAAPGLTAQVVCKFLPQAPELKELQLDFQYFDPALWDLDALDALVSRVQSEPSQVAKLVLDWCRLGDAGARCVCAALARHARDNEGVKELSLAHCELKDLSSVCEMLEAPLVALTSLDLSANSFGDLEGQKLAKALPFSGIKDLRLRDSQVSERMPVKTKWSWAS